MVGEIPAVEGNPTGHELEQRGSGARGGERGNEPER
jgi:hypothetical protein